MDFEQTVDTATVARFLLLTPHRVRQLAAQGVLEKVLGPDGAPLRGRFNLLGCVNAYIRYLRSHSNLNTVDQYTLARARRMSALADVEQLRLKRIHGELHHGRDVKFLLTQMITACRQRLLALPARLCRPLQGKTDLVGIAEILREEVESALRELSEYDPAAFEAANEEYLASINVAKPPADKNGAGLSREGDVEREP